MFCFCSKLQEQNKTDFSSQKIKLKKKSLVTFFTVKVEKCSDSPRFMVLATDASPHGLTAVLAPFLIFYS